MTKTVDRELVRLARDDIEYFARACVREPLWPHQLEAAKSPARIRVLRAGRQVGKSRLLAVLALWEAFRAPNRHVMILSAGEDSAKDLLAEVVALATGSPLLAGSIVDESLSRVILSNGSWVRSIPASAKQARGKSIDLLVIDEAAFVSDEVWRAAKYSQAARPGSRLLLASSPYGRRDGFFAVHDRLGAGGLTEVGGVSVESFVWPSTVSPLVRAAGLVEFWRQTDPPRVFAAEVLAEWQDEQGSWFTAEEIHSCVADYVMAKPGEGQAVDGSRMRREVSSRFGLCVGGLDFGYQKDSNALVLLGVLDDRGLNEKRAEATLFIPWIVEAQRMRYHEFEDLVLDACDPSKGGYAAEGLIAEVNSVGEPVAQSLKLKVAQRRMQTKVVSAWTDNKRKLAGFSQLKMWMQSGRLVLPRHPGLLRQLDALQFETLESGATRIAVPEAGGGHDDLVMALLQAASAMRSTCSRTGPAFGYDPSRSWGSQLRERDEVASAGVVATSGGVVVPEFPNCLNRLDAYQPPRSPETGDGW